jgi:ketosteroid isomerase-like protein
MENQIMDRDPIAVTQELFVRFGAGDVPAIVELLDENIRIQFYGPPVIPYAGEYHGREQARRFFTTVLSSVDIHEFEPEQFLADGDMVTVTGHLHLTARSTGRDIRSDFAHVIQVKNGKWLRFRDFMDTASAVAAFTG